MEGIWSLPRKDRPANTAFSDNNHPEHTLRRALRHIQLRPGLIDGCPAETGLELTHHPTTGREGSQDVGWRAHRSSGVLPKTADRDAHGRREPQLLS